MGPFEVARKLGIKVRPNGVMDGSVPWDGEFLYGLRTIEPRPIPHKTDDIWHEIGHWIVAPPVHRRLGDGNPSRRAPRRQRGPPSL